jgi:hypothetical protein
VIVVVRVVMRQDTHLIGTESLADVHFDYVVRQATRLGEPESSKFDNTT